jgi:ABC-type transporter Mla subunit MlaD
MKRHENPQDVELQRHISEQEQAMSQLLQRVMERPLAPLHKILEDLRSQIAAVQQASIHAAQSVEAGLSEVLEGQSKRLNRHVNDVADGVDSLKEELTGLVLTLEKRHDGQVERDQHMQDSLARAGDVLVQLDAKADAANGALAATAADLAKVDDALGTVREQQQVAVDRFSQELGGLGGRLEQQQAHFDGSLGRTTSVLEQLDTRAAAANESLAAAVRAVATVDAELGTLREQEQTSASRLNGGLDKLAQQLDRQQTGLCERIDALMPALAPHFDTLAATVDQSSRETAARYDALSESQKALVAATVQEQLALQLAPFQTRTKWLVAVCALSLASTVALLGLQLIH